MYTIARPLKSQEKNLLAIPSVTTKHGEAAFSCHAAKLWNQLPDNIKDAPTIASFKTRPKTKLFSDAFMLSELMLTDYGQA